MPTEEARKIIDALSTEEIDIEVARGSCSRFQREKFAYLKTVQTRRRDEMENEHRAEDVQIKQNEIKLTEDANRLARDANRYSLIALVISVVAVAVALVGLFY